MSNFPILSGGLVNITPEDGTFTSLTSSATAYAFTAWTQLTASSSACAALRFFASGDAYANTQFQLGIGGSGSEVVFYEMLRPASNVQSGGGASLNWSEAEIPIQIPSGARISVRLRSSNTSRPSYIRLYGIAPSPLFPMGFNSGIHFGLNTSTLVGTTTITEGSTSAPGTWVSLGTLPNDIRGISITPTFKAANWGDGLQGTWQIGIGSAPSVICSFTCASYYNDWPVGAIGPVTPISLASGTTIYGRWYTYTGSTSSRQSSIVATLYR